MTAPYRELGWVSRGSGAYAHFVRHHYVTDDGTWVPRDRLHHPGSVVVVPIDGDDVLLLSQWRSGAGRDMVEVVAGIRDHDEAAEVAAARECEEEVGMRPGRLVHLGEWWASPGISDERMTCFLAEALDAVGRRPDGVEERGSHVVRVPVGEAIATAAAGGYADLKTTAALLVAGRILEARGDDSLGVSDGAPVSSG